MINSAKNATDLFGQADAIDAALKLLIASYDRGGKLMICGNGGSAADCEHIVGELMKGFCLPRKLSTEDREKLVNSGGNGKMLAECLQYGLPAISLVSHTSLITAITNDINSDMIFAQQVWAIGKQDDLLLAISTSGNSINVLHAAETARAKSIPVIGLTGHSGGKLASLCNVLIAAPSNHVAKIQEMHLPLYHEICRRIEAHYFTSK